MAQIRNSTDEGSEYYNIKNRMLEIKKKRLLIKQLEPSHQKVRLAVEVEMKEKTLHKRIIRKFSKIKGHNREEIYPDVFLEPEKVLDNIMKRIIEPCERISRAQDKVAMLQ